MEMQKMDNTTSQHRVVWKLGNRNSISRVITTLSNHEATHFGTQKIRNHSHSISQEPRNDHMRTTVQAKSRKAESPRAAELQNRKMNESYIHNKT